MRHGLGSMQQAPPSPASPSASPFSYPVFRQVWTGSLISSFGLMIQAVGASWLMVSLSGAATDVALVQSATTLPIALLALLAGALADGYDRRIIMIVAQFAMLATSILLALWALLGWLNPTLLLCFTFVIGCGMALNAPSWAASVGDMVPREALPSAVAFNAMQFNIARSLAPAIGGAVVAAVGAAFAFVLNALSYVWLIIVLLRWDAPKSTNTLPRERLTTAVGAGIRYIAMSPALRTVLARSILFGGSAASMSALMPIVARDLLGGGALTYGLLLGAFGLGSVASALYLRRVRARFTTEVTVRLGVLMVAAGSGIMALSASLVVSLAGCAIGGLGWLLVLSTLNASMQLASPRWVVGRAIASYQMMVFAGLAGGAWAFGALAQAEGVRFALGTAAALQLANVALGFAMRLPQMGAENMDLIELWEVPETEVPVEARSGPIVIMINYRIAPDNVLAFLHAMNERRRIRIRDGARHWSLSRDLGDEYVWQERYQVPTWADYIRHNQRRTHADMATSEALVNLHEGSWPPPVMRMIERQTTAWPAHRADTNDHHHPIHH